MICDDFSTDISIGQEWVATVTTLADIQSRVGASPGAPQTPTFTTGTPTGTITNLDVANYALAGVLATQLMSNLGNPTAKSQSSFAIWAIFTPSILTTPPGGIDLTVAKQYILDATNVVANATAGGVFGGGTVDLALLPFSALTIYTPTLAVQLAGVSAGNRPRGAVSSGTGA